MAAMRSNSSMAGGTGAAMMMMSLGGACLDCDAILCRGPESATARGHFELARRLEGATCSVMLHLRFCYVSKAAIFTIPSPPRRSKIEVPLEFQGLESLGATVEATVLPLRI